MRNYAPLFLPLALLAAPALAQSDFTLKDGATPRFRIQQDGGVSIGSASPLIEQFLIENLIPGRRTFTIRSDGGSGLKERLALESNLSEPYDLNFRNVVCQMGTIDPAVSGPVQVMQYAPTGQSGNAHAIYKPGSNSQVIWRVSYAGSMSSYITGITGAAWNVQAPTDTTPRFTVDQFGKLLWGPGTALQDVTLERLSAGRMKITGSVTIDGAVAQKVVTKSVSATLLPGERYVNVDATAAPVTITLAAASTCTGEERTIKRISGVANSVTVAPPSGQTIDSHASWTLGAQWSALTVYSDGAAWQIKSQLGTVS